jgi:hypothetical protein
MAASSLLSTSMFGRSELHPVASFFAWLLLQNRVWTADRLLPRQWQNEYFYPLSRRNMETACHLFLECPLSHCLDRNKQMAFLALAEPAKLESDLGLQDWSAYVAGSSSSVRDKGGRSMVILGCWIM